MSKGSTKLKVLHDLFEENNIHPNLMEGNDALIEAVKENAGTVKDYRHQSYIRHPLVSIIMIVFFAVLAIWIFPTVSPQMIRTASSWEILIRNIFSA